MTLAVRAAFALVLTAGLLACSGPAPRARLPDSVPRTIPTECNISEVTAEQHGEVIVRFDVSPSGDVIDPKVVYSCPRGLFDEHTLETVREWKYERTSSGKKDVTVHLDFAPQ